MPGNSLERMKTQSAEINEIHGSSLKVKLHYAYKVRNIGRVRPILRYCVV